MTQRILIIEDDRDLAKMIATYLQREAWKTWHCTNGGQALKMVAEAHPTLILLDLMLPEVDGLELLRQIRLTSMVPIIIVSAKETELDRILGLKLGADDYLTKPFSLKELVARVAALLRRSLYVTKVHNTTMQFNGIHVDLLARTVTCHQKQLALTLKEFDLLVFLAKHPAQVLSKEQLYNHVWGLNEYGEINTVVIHIQKLREKLAVPQLITTVRGIGYRFDGELDD